MAYNPPIGSIYTTYNTIYILPSGGVICYLPPFRGTRNNHSPKALRSSSFNAFNHQFSEAKMLVSGRVKQPVPHNLLRFPIISRWQLSGSGMAEMEGVEGWLWILKCPTKITKSSWGCNFLPQKCAKHGLQWCFWLVESITSKHALFPQRNKRVMPTLSSFAPNATWKMGSWKMFGLSPNGLFSTEP